MQGKIYLLLFGGLGAAYAVSEADKGLNYVETTGKITQVATDCYVEYKSGKRTQSVVHKETGDLLYMECEFAPFAAEKYGIPESGVKKRVQLKYEYVSPVDNSVQVGERTFEGTRKEYDLGQEIKMYAHVSKPAKYRNF